MEVAQVLHMNKGNNETSYAKNSMLQNTIISVTKPAIEKAMLQILSGNNVPGSVGIADLGCSSGPNSLLVTAEMIDLIHAKCRNLYRPLPEIRAFLNDLPGNDFNYICESLPAFFKKLEEEKGAGVGDVCLSCVAGSFYGRLFPRNSLHFVHSSSSLHWLSKGPSRLTVDDKTAPLNKGKLYISKSSPPCVVEAYSSQFEEDFSLFLKSRAEEVVPGGRILLSFMGRRSIDPTTEESCYHWELLARVLMSMASEGLVEESKVDSFNAPFYTPCPEEIKSVMEKEGSFTVDAIEAFEIDWDAGIGSTDPLTGETLSRGQRVSNTIRAVVESMLAYHFGQDIMDDLFLRYANIVDDYLSKTGAKFINLVVSFTRKSRPSSHHNIFLDWVKFFWVK